MLEISDLHVSYGTTRAVRGLDLSVPEGGRVALLGANGAGKSSTLRAISGLVEHSGTIRFDGVDIGSWKPDRIARAGLIHVPEGRHIFGPLTVADNLRMGEVARGDRAPTHTYDDVLDLFPALSKLIERPGWMLSGGEQQMVVLGRAILGSPRLLMLDEPSLGLAPAIVSMVFEALKAIGDTTTVLLVEQSTTLALDFCERASVLANGRAVMEDEAASLRSRTDLVDAYLGTASVVDTGARA